VKLAVELGADVNTANNNGSMALDGAQALGYESAVKFLEERGAKSGRKIRREKPEIN
jgi:hypothetical protein